MRHFIISAIGLLLFSTAIFADGLIYQLPEDGTSVAYEMEITVGQADLPVLGDGTLTVSSVGQAVVDNEKCRWLEFNLKMKLAGRDQSVISKFLIPEKHLGRGKSPVDHVKKYWLKVNNSEVHASKDIKGQMGGTLYAFLSGPLQDVKKLEPEDVESQLGNLLCECSTGRLEFQHGDKNVSAEIDAWLHDKAPFGVVAWSIEIGSLSSNGLLRENVYMTAQAGPTRHERKIRTAQHQREVVDDRETGPGVSSSRQLHRQVARLLRRSRLSGTVPMGPPRRRPVPTSVKISQRLPCRHRHDDNPTAYGRNDGSGPRRAHDQDCLCRADRTGTSGDVHPRPGVG